MVNLTSRAPVSSLPLSILLTPFHLLQQLGNAERRCYLVCHKSAILLIQSQVSKFVMSKFRALIVFLPEP